MGDIWEQAISHTRKTEEGGGINISGGFCRLIWTQVGEKKPYSKMARGGVLGPQDKDFFV